MPASDPNSNNTRLTSGTARKRREDRRTPTGSGPVTTPMARPRRKLGGNPAGEPPVISRQPTGGMATPRRSGGKRSLADSISSESWVGRRYDIALPITGAEMRLPALPLIHGDWRFLSGILTVIFAVFSYFFVFSPVFQVNEVEYRGLERLSPGDVNLVMDAIGKPVIAVSPSRLEERILTTFPDLSSAEVKIILPAKLSIKVTERQPVILWKNGGTERWIDSEGMVFPVRGNLAVEASETMSDTVKALVTLQADSLPFPPNAAEDLLGKANSADQEAIMLAAAAALALNGPRQIDQDLVNSVLTLSTILPADTALVYTEAHGLGWRDPSGWEVYFGNSFQTGSSAELEQKQLVYQEIVKYLAANGIQPVLVSVENVHAPYYRMER